MVTGVAPCLSMGVEMGEEGHKEINKARIMVRDGGAAAAGSAVDAVPWEWERLDVPSRDGLRRGGSQSITSCLCFVFGYVSWTRRRTAVQQQILPPPLLLPIRLDQKAARARESWEVKEPTTTERQNNDFLNQVVAHACQLLAHVTGARWQEEAAGRAHVQII
jgi:hypothetical protein